MTTLAYAPSEWATCQGCGLKRRINPSRPAPVHCRDCSKMERAKMRDDWKGRGACRDHDPELWYPTTTDPVDAEPAKRICDTCLVRVACLNSALERREDYGVWGGLTVRERHQILRDRLRAFTD